MSTKDTPPTDRTLKRELLWTLAVVEGSAALGALIYGASVIEWVGTLLLAGTLAMLVRTIVYLVKGGFD